MNRRKKQKIFLPHLKIEETTTTKDKHAYISVDLTILYLKNVHIVDVFLPRTLYNLDAFIIHLN